jgi:hypothetical protein
LHEEEMAKIITNVDASENKNILPKRDFHTSEDDLKLHQEFITKHLKENMWGY